MRPITRQTSSLVIGALYCCVLVSVRNRVIVSENPLGQAAGAPSKDRNNECQFQPLGRSFLPIWHDGQSSAFLRACFFLYRVTVHFNLRMQAGVIICTFRKPLLHHYAGPLPSSSSPRPAAFLRCRPKYVAGAETAL